ncbi:uveal autoantigen with coiled-coil domains and ankyrin repeats [Bactrocera oleae]|uniref:uveal autoantigen with coiled-coil domains and ankyrin repeats n=1 Tax=Bactrocera oleae TaxID=104688 RepID=UPI0006B7C907|nr:uncharacterized protein LOC106622464 [Bactrocera oleae]
MVGIKGLREKHAARQPANLMMAPKPVHPRAVRTHGFFGVSFVRQHMVIDDRWTPTSLTEQFKGMADLLSKRLVFKKLEAAANHKRYIRENRNLKRQCRDGRTKLSNVLYGDNTKKIRNFLINHKDMQRLYQKMPVELVVDNINQRTFVMRKERDRLKFRLDQLKNVYKEKLLERAVLQNRIKYENEFVLEEELKSRVFRKKIENSNVRLKAIKTINGTYRKMIQVLRHDGIFYEPILRSLSQDIEDQSNFIKHILYLGMPAIAKFKELSEEYRQMEDKSRKSMQTKLQMMSQYRKEGKRASVPKLAQKPEDPLSNAKRYVRETASMLFLKNELEVIEDTIKQVKFATLCSQAKEIYPRIKSQVENNFKLNKMIENDMLGHQTLETKMKRAEVLEGILVNNLSEQEIERLDRIQELKDAIKQEDQEEERMIAYIKNRADAYVMLRFSLWNLSEILRHVDRPDKPSRIKYPNSYLRLPLLKFEMLTMRACPPEHYEENIDTIMHSVIRKVYKLMRAYKEEVPAATMERYIDSYQNEFLDSMEIEDAGDSNEVQEQEEEEDLLQESKPLQNVPNRKQIKAQSAKLVEELSKKED